MKHASDLKFCGCRSCRRGLHREGGDFFAKYMRHTFRRQTKILCKQAKYDPYIEIPTKIGVGYTD